jgi:hypothetical protein
MSPPRWPEVATTKEEKFLFVALTIEEKVWRSAEGLARELGWSTEAVADLFDRFADMGVIVQNPSNPKLFGYWERVEIERQNGTGTPNKPDSRP